MANERPTAHHSPSSFPSFGGMQVLRDKAFKRSWGERFQPVPAPGHGSRCQRATHVARRSQCPAAKWRDAVAALLAASGQRLRGTRDGTFFIEVGANKGYDLIEFLQRFGGDGAAATAQLPTAWGWLSALRAAGLDQPSEHACGMCFDCLAKRAPSSSSSAALGAAAESGGGKARVWAIDLNAGNLAMVAAATKAINLTGISTHHHAVSNVSGRAYRLANTQAGSEWGSLAGANAVVNASAIASAVEAKSRVDTITLDHFASRHLPSPHTELTMLSVDAEGWGRRGLAHAKCLACWAPRRMLGVGSQC